MPQVQQGPAQRPPGDDRQAAFVSTVLASTEGCLGPDLSSRAGRSTASPSWCFSGAHAHSLRHRPKRHSRFTAFWRPKVHLDMDFFDTMRAASWVPRRVRLRLCDRPRGGPPRADPAGPPRARWTACAGASASVTRTRCRCAWSSGRLLRRHLGAAHLQQAKNWLDQATSTGHQRRAADRRRHAAAPADRHRVRPDVFTHGSSAQRVRWFSQA